MKSIKPKPFPEMSEEEVETMRNFFKSCKTLPTASPQEVMQMIRELREIGLEDIPEYEGVSSSLRQFVWGVLGHKAALANGTTTDNDFCFLTTNKPLLERADALHAMYGVKVMDAVSYLKGIAEGQGNSELARQLELMKQKMERE